MSNTNGYKKDIKDINRKRRVSYGFTVFLVVLAIIFFLFILNIMLGINLFKAEEVDQISYSEKSKLTYDVCLNSNEFFEEQCLTMDKEYIASLIDTVNSNFIYTFSAAKSLDIKYSYYIEAQLIATERIKQKVIYDKKEILVTEKEFVQKNSNGYNISEKISIDYEKYNNRMKEFKKEYAILFDSKLILSLYVVTDAKYEKIEDNIKSKQVMKMEIPLSEQTVDIKFSQKDINNSTTVYEENGANTKKLVTKAFYFSNALMLSLIAGCVIFIRRKLQHHTKFEMEVSKIMKEYDRFITTITNIPNFDEKEVLKVTTFQELLDTRECLNKPIIYYEMKKREKGCFIIMSEDVIYLHVIGK